ncbi:MAG: ABC transporter permease [Candidatus Zixiibacteriota bacterium]|nr:MAG: ABC transporter permease [candidate division Zixibacteria bacterium]
MLHNFLKSAIRSLLRRKGQSAISILGLTVGLACSIMISIWVSGELSYDSFHTSAPYIYQVYHDSSRQGPTALAPFLKESYPEIENTARVHPRWWQIGHQDESCNARVHCVDPSFLSMFSFDLLQGDAARVLESPESIVLSESLAARIFGDEDPIGQTISIEKRQNVMVTGVMKDVPFNSHLQFEALVNVRFLNVIFSWFPPMDSWEDGDMWNYVMVKPGTDVTALLAKVQQFADARGFEVQMRMEPIREIYLAGSGDGNPPIVYIYVFIGAALLILLSAGVNYVNLATARASDRAREVGIRKVVGARRSHLIRQFMGETVVVATVSAILALSLAEFLREPFEALVNRNLSSGVFTDPVLVVGVLVVALITGVIAGIYPSLVLSSFQPTRVFRVSSGRGGRTSLIRRALVVGQFSISIFLITGAMVVYHQMDYLKSKDLGYNHEAILYLTLQSDIFAQLQPIMNDLDANPNVLRYTFTNTMLDRRESTTRNVAWEGQLEGEEICVGVQSAGYSFAEVFGIEMVEGRFFSPNFATDLESGYIVNEAAVAAMNMTSPVGKRFSLSGQDGRIVGVVKDYHHRSLHYEIQPLVLAIRPGWSDNLAIRVAPADIVGTARAIQAIVKKYVPDYPVEVRFFDERLEAHYRSERRTASMLTAASILAVFMSCLGLIGLVSYAVRQRAREIGIRKVLGSSVTAILRLITTEFIVGVGLACLIAWPLAYYAADRWLTSFAYAISPSWLTFAVAGGLTLLIALSTAGHYALRAAQANPSDALRCE